MGGKGTILNNNDAYPKPLSDSTTHCVECAKFNAIHCTSVKLTLILKDVIVDESIEKVKFASFFVITHVAI